MYVHRYSNCIYILETFTCIYSGSVSVTNEMATVTIDGLACGVTYSIIAGGTLNGVLVGPKSSHGIITGPCPPLIITTTAATTSMAGKKM